MNEALLPLCPGRSLEAIKGQRRNKAHKELVKGKLVKITMEGLHITGDEGKGTSVEGEEGRGEGQGPSRRGPASGTLDRTQGHLNQWMLHMNIVRFSRSIRIYKDKIGKVWDPEEETGVGTDRKVIDDWAKEQLKWVRWGGNPKPKPVRKPDKKQAFISKKHEKARLRQLTQSFY